MEITLKELKEMGNLNEDILDFFKSTKKDSLMDKLDNLQGLHDILTHFMKSVNVSERETALADTIYYKIESAKNFLSSDLKQSRKSRGAETQIGEIETVYLPELLQLLANNYSKKFKKAVHPDLLKFYGVSIPETNLETTSVKPSYFPDIVDEMLMFAKSVNFSKSYINKLELRLQLAKQFKATYEKNPQALAEPDKQEMINNFVKDLKKIMAYWRNTYNNEYNSFFKPMLKDFALNE